MGKAIIPEIKNKTIAYLKTSMLEQDTARNKKEMTTFASRRNFGKVIFVEEKISGAKSWKERTIKNIIDELGENDRLIVPELSRLGRSMLEIMEILSQAKQKGISIYDVKNNFELNGNIQSGVLAAVFRIASEIERDLISKRTAAALRTARAKGKKLGRPTGAGKSKLDAHREEIITLLKNGSTQVHIAKTYHTTQPNLYNWLRKNKLEDVKPVYA